MTDGAVAKGTHSFFGVQSLSAGGASKGMAAEKSGVARCCHADSAFFLSSFDDFCQHLNHASSRGTVTEIRIDHSLHQLPQHLRGAAVPLSPWIQMLRSDISNPGSGSNHKIWNTLPLVKSLQASQKLQQNNGESIDVCRRTVLFLVPSNDRIQVCKRSHELGHAGGKYQFQKNGATRHTASTTNVWPGCSKNELPKSVNFASSFSSSKMLSALMSLPPTPE